MNERPKISGYYWASFYYGKPEILYVAPNLKTVWRVGEQKPTQVEFITKWYERVAEWPVN